MTPSFGSRKYLFALVLGEVTFVAKVCTKCCQRTRFDWGDTETSFSWKEKQSKQLWSIMIWVHSNHNTFNQQQQNESKELRMWKGQYIAKKPPSLE